MKHNKTKLAGAFLTAFGILQAQAPQAPNPTQQLNPNENEARMAAGAMPVYRITVVERSTKAINYRNRGGATKIDFRGTPLLPKSHGEAKVESKQGYIEIEVEFRELQPATAYGSEYLTYVMWGITPEGRTSNLGEVLLNGTSAKLNVTTELQSFGLIVTAEPYFAVTQPSDVVVMENAIRPDTLGKVQPVEAKYELLKRGQYTLNVNPAEAKPRLDPKAPLDLHEARNAVQIARWTGAQRYAPESFKKAVDGLATAEGYLKRKAGTKPIATASREAVQMAEDARIITVKKIGEEVLANERQAGANREAGLENARAAAQSDATRTAQDAERARMAAQTEAQRLARENGIRTAVTLAESDRLKRDSEVRLAAAQSETSRLRQDNVTQAAALQTEVDRLKRDNAQAIENAGAAAQTETQRVAREHDAKIAAAQAEADRLKQANDTQAAAAQTEADRLKRENNTQAAAAQAEADRLKQANDTRAAAAQTEVDRLKRENGTQTAAAQTEAGRLKLVNDARTAAAQSEADRLKRENDAQTAASLTEADRLKRENDSQRAASQAGLDRAAGEKAQAETDKTQLRALLLTQFNAILQTRDTARGLIVNMSDVLFDTAKYSLRPAAREKLAKVAGIFSGHPGLRLQVEGYTDSVGGDGYNQQLSENRAGSVRDYLTGAGIPTTSVTAKGFGKTLPVATNETSSGRQQNRRVELVVSGDIIGADLRPSPVLAAK